MRSDYCASAPVPARDYISSTVIDRDEANSRTAPGPVPTINSSAYTHLISEYRRDLTSMESPL